MDQKLFAILKKKMLKEAGDSAHDEQHVYRVLRMALHLMKFETNVDEDVLIAACLLHDIGRQAQYENPSLSHAVVGTEMAWEFLQEQGLPESFIQHVCACIRTHSYRKNDPPESVEAKLLFDADKLDVCGAMGVARTLLYQGHENLPLYETDAEGRPMRTAERFEESFFTEADDKLQKVHGRMLTEEATRIAKKRKSALDAFVNALWEEINFK